MKNIFVIGIAGGTGSGKTTVVNKIINELPQNKICVISQDAYYNKTENLSHEQRCQINFDHPKAIDFELLVTHLNQLKKNQEIQQPIYSFENHNRTKNTLKTIPKKVIIVEGILIFNSEKLRNICDMKIFVHADADERLIRRIRRDCEERGRTIDEILSRYQQTLKPMHQQFIEPTKNYADIIIPNDTRNNVAVDFVKTVISEHL